MAAPWTCCSVCKPTEKTNIASPKKPTTGVLSNKGEPSRDLGDKGPNIGLGLSAELGEASEGNGKKRGLEMAPMPKSAAVVEAIRPSPATDAGSAEDTSNELEDLWSMPFQRARRARRRNQDDGGLKGWALIREKKSTMVVLHKFLSSQKEEASAAAISLTNPPAKDMLVVRGPAWKFGNQDGGAGKIGTIKSINEQAGTCAVFWHDTQRLVDHYQYDVRSDLCVAPEDSVDRKQSSKDNAKPSSKGRAGSKTSNRSDQRRPSLLGAVAGLIKPSLNGEAGDKTAMVDESKEKEAKKNGFFGALGFGAKAKKDGEADSTSPLTSPLKSSLPGVDEIPAEDTDAIEKPVLQRRNSQADFAKTEQTIIIFDWDDTLFPTTYVRDDLNLSCSRPVEKQRGLSHGEVRDITGKLQRCEIQAEKLLRQAHALGKVVFVTLAKSPWVSCCCTNFYPRMGEAVKALKVPIVYAQEGVHVDYNKQKMMSNDEIERFYSNMKGKAIGREVRSFYNQYEGQSWKNIISIGDSDFERLGTFQASEQYLKEKGLIGEDAVDLVLTEGGRIEEMVSKDGHVFHVRTKSFKMIDQPTPQELEVELPMIRGWLPQLVFLNRGCDFDLDALDSHAHIKEIEDTLQGVKLPSSKGTVCKTDTLQVTLAKGGKTTSQKSPKTPPAKGGSISVSSSPRQSSLGNTSPRGSSRGPSPGSSSPRGGSKDKKK